MSRYMTDDITFCSKHKCGRKSCPRHSDNRINKTIPFSCADLEGTHYCEKVKTANDVEHNLLKDWYFERRSDGNVVLLGTIYNDIKGRFADGTPIHTSRVLKADFVNGVVETKNSVYHLKLRSNNEQRKAD